MAYCLVSKTAFPLNIGVGWDWLGNARIPLKALLLALAKCHGEERLSEIPGANF